MALSNTGGITYPGNETTPLTGQGRTPGMTYESFKYLCMKFLCCGAPYIFYCHS